MTVGNDMHSLETCLDIADREAIAFDYESPHGDYRVIYHISGLAWITPFFARILHNRSRPEVPAEARWIFDPSDRRQSWRHDLDVRADLLALTPEDAEDKYRAFFDEADIRNTFLETPDELALPRVSIETLPSTNQPITLVYRADGRGHIISTKRWREISYELDIDCAMTVIDPFDHCLDDEMIGRHALFQKNHPWKAGREDRLSDNDAAKRIQDLYEKTFWNQINRTLADPFVRFPPGDLEQGLAFKQGDEELLRHLMSCAARLDDELWSLVSRPREIMVLSATPETPATIPSDHTDNVLLSPSTLTIVHALLDWFEPTGYHLEPGKGDHARVSGHDKIGRPILIEVAAPTAIEQMESLENLFDWSQSAGIDLMPLLPP